MVRFGLQASVHSLVPDATPPKQMDLSSDATDPAEPATSKYRPSLSPAGFMSPREPIDTRMSQHGAKAKTRRISEAMVCEIAVFLWPFEPLESSVR